MSSRSKIDTVFILGAGASADFKVPLMNNFIDVAEDVARDLAKKGNTELESILTKIRGLRPVQSKAKIDLNNIESVLGILEMAEMLEVAPNNFQEFKSLRSSYLYLIRETIERSGTFIIDGSGYLRPRGSYFDFARLIKAKYEANSAIITFNYDVGLDFAMNNAGLNYSYCLEEEPIRNQYPFLKLHGSLNWYKSNNKLYDLSVRQYSQSYNKGNPNLSGNNEIIISFKRMFVNEFPENNEPYIVAPTWNKANNVEQLRCVWKNAITCLQSATNVVVIGYSLPETDSFFSYLFSLGINSDTRIRKFQVINNDPNIEARYKRLIGPQIEDRFDFQCMQFSEAIRAMNSH